MKVRVRCIGRAGHALQRARHFMTAGGKSSGQGSPRVLIYTDGACSGNPGPGGWGAVLLYNGQRKEICGGEVDTTNNRMELQAAIQALRTLKRRSTVALFTDSRHAMDQSMESQRMAHRRQKSGEKCGSLATTRRANRRTRCYVALG